MRRGHPDPTALDDKTVERLLAGDLPAALAPPGYAGVAALLEATVAPPAPEELAGERAALSELRAATRARAAADTRRAGTLRRRRRVGLAAVAVAGALATGGAAAAATGHLPAPVRDAARTIVVAVGGGAPAAATRPGAPPASATPSAASGGAGRAGQGAAWTGSTGRDPAGTGPGSVASPYLQGLCRAYAAGEGDEQGEKLDAAAFEALARTAGGAGRIAAFCQSVSTGSPGSSAGGHGRQGGPPASTGPGDQGQNGPPPSSNGANPAQGPPATQSHGG